MRVLVVPGPPVGGRARLPGDKSIAHRWLILAATAVGRSELHDLPPSLDVRSTARCLAAIVPEARAELEAWASTPPGDADRHGFTTNNPEPRGTRPALEVRGGGRAGLEASAGPLDCGNSGTTMRLLAGVLASAPFVSVLEGDASLMTRPMERVAAPLRAMGASVGTREGRPPLRISGGALQGIAHRPEVPSAQVKGAVLLGGLDAEGETTVIESVPTRDHTERALEALGAPIESTGTITRVRRGTLEGFRGRVPGDVSSAAFLVGASVLTGGELRLEGVGLNPTRTRYLEVLARMGARVAWAAVGEELGEPVGWIHVEPGTELAPTSIGPDELPLVIDEVPLLAAVAVHAPGETRLGGAGELRVKESDRLGGTAAMLGDLGGSCAVEGEDLVIGGRGLAGGSTRSGGDHRLAMAAVVAALRARGPSTIEGTEAAEVSYPGFASTLAALGASLEVAP